MAGLRDVVGFAAKALATKAGMAMVGFNPKKRKKDETTKKAFVIGTALALLKGAAGAGASLATKALATKAGMAMALNPRMSSRQLRTFHKRAKQLDAARQKLTATLGKTLDPGKPLGTSDLRWQKALGGVRKQMRHIKSLEGQLGIKRNPGSPIFSNPKVQWIPFGRGYLYAVESTGGRYPSWHWAVRRANTIYGAAASGGRGADSKAAAIAWAKDHITRAMASDKRLAEWKRARSHEAREKTHGARRNPKANPLLMVVPNPRLRRGDPLVLKTANEAWGFFGTIAGMYGQAVAEYAWEVAFKELLKGGWKPYTVRLFLDAKHGRHVADQVQVAGIPAKPAIRTAVLKALKTEARWIVRTLPEMDDERKKGGVRWNPGRTLVPGGKGSVVLGWKSKDEAKAYVRKKNRDGYVASVHPGRAGAPAASRWVTICSRHKIFLGSPGRNPGAEWHAKQAKEAAQEVSKAPKGSKAEWFFRGEASAQRFSATAAARKAMPNPGSRWHLAQYRDADDGVHECAPGEEKYWEGVKGAHWDSYQKSKKIGPYAKKPTAKNPGYLLAPRVCALRTIAASGRAGVVDGRKVDPVIAGAVLKFLSAQTHNWADTLAREPVTKLIAYTYKNAKKR